MIAAAPTPDSKSDATAFPPSLLLVPLSRWPTTLPDDTVRTVLRAPLPCDPLLIPAAGIERQREGVERVSIIVLTHNNVVFNRLCLESILLNTSYPDYEIVVVDNGSDDGTPAYLRSLTQRCANVRVLFNERNRGFAPATNQGIAAATGAIFVLLNNDTIVPPGWLEALVPHLSDRGIGMVGPVTNRTGNEAEIEAAYRTYGEFVRFAHDHCRSHDGRSFDIRMLAMFCAGFRRDAYERVGPLDECFAVGLFEDDDYAMRMRAAGYRVICAEGAFVHHFGQGSLGRLASDGEYGRLFHENRRRWEEKWRMPWQPYERRLKPDYQLLKNRIREVVETVVPPSGRVLVVSKGDDELLNLNGRPAWHFPQAETGGYAGCNPRDAAAAIAHLEELRVRGADFLLIPSTALWWLDYYSGLKEHLEERYRCLAAEDDVCLIVELGNRSAANLDARYYYGRNS